MRPTDTMNHTNTMTLPMLSKPAGAHTNITAFLGEFIGTFLFLFFSFAGAEIAINSGAAALEPGADMIGIPSTQNLMFTALVSGLSLMANAWAFYRVTGGLFNPSVTLALFLVGGLSAVRSVIVVIAQLLAGMAAAGVVSALFPGPVDVGTTLGGGASVVQGLFIEMLLTAELVFVVIMVAAEKHKSTYLAPVAIGMAFFLAELVGVYFTGGSLNFARSLGPAVVNRNFPSYFWIYFLGPVLGSLLASGFYALLKYLRWKECNPGQDVDDEEKLKFNNARIQEKERYGSAADGHATPRETVTPPNGAVSPSGTTVADSPTAPRALNYNQHEETVGRVA
ncbi:aquaporin-like protein [Apiosordaria backusii]|uniref:Aquaporin-like protein n=1 Tax=Apiosordaria backusii TaxID=314023 RepID=A0AA40B210_9PEZI|nr:aquaporin-like protein [Apiosordaria backusii]